MDSDRYNDLRSTDLLIKEALATEDDEGYYHLVGVLKYRGTQEVFEAAKLLIESDDPDQRILGVDILSELGLPGRVFLQDTIQILVALLGHETNDDVIQMICYAFGRNPDAGMVEPLAKLKDHPNPRVRESAVFGLLGQEDAVAVQAMIQLSIDVDDDVRNWATFALGDMIDIDTPGIREALLRNVDDTFDAVRGEALKGLAKRNDERAIIPLIHELELIAEADEWWDYAFDAAENMPDTRLYSALMMVKESGVDDKSLDHAIALCRIPAPSEEEEPDDLPTTCPVCGLRDAFVEDDKWSFCSRCGWENDAEQRADPDSTTSWNPRSINTERERWKMRLQAGK